MDRERNEWFNSETNQRSLPVCLRCWAGARMPKLDLLSSGGVVIWPKIWAKQPAVSPNLEAKGRALRVEGNRALKGAWIKAERRTKHHSVNCGRWDGFHTGAGLVNQVKRRRRDGNGPAGFERRGDGHDLVLVSFPPFVFLPAFSCSFPSLAPSFLPHFLFHEAGSLWPRRRFEHRSCLKELAWVPLPKSSLGTGWRLWCQHGPGTKDLAQDEGKEGKIFPILIPLEGTCHLAVAAGTTSGDFFYSAAWVQGSCRGLCSEEGRSEVKAMNNVHMERWQITCNKCRTTLQSTECTRASL